MANENDNARESLSQCKMIAAWLQSGKSITSLEALKMFGCMRLASRICDLRERGMEINMQKVRTSTGKYVAEYSMSK